MVPITKESYIKLIVFLSNNEILGFTFERDGKPMTHFLKKLYALLTEDYGICYPILLEKAMLEKIAEYILDESLINENILNVSR